MTCLRGRHGKPLGWVLYPLLVVFCLAVSGSGFVPGVLTWGGEAAQEEVQTCAEFRLVGARRYSPRFTGEVVVAPVMSAAGRSTFAVRPALDPVLRIGLIGAGVRLLV